MVISIVTRVTHNFDFHVIVRIMFVLTSSPFEIKSKLQITCR